MTTEREGRQALFCKLLDFPTLWHNIAYKRLKWTQFVSLAWVACDLSVKSGLVADQEREEQQAWDGQSYACYL